MSASTEKILGQKLRFFKKNVVLRKFVGERGGWSAYQVLLTKIFFLRVTKNVVGGNLLCFRNLLVSKTFTDRQGARREGISRFFVDVFLSHSADKILGEHFSVEENFGYPKTYGPAGKEWDGGSSTFF